ETELTKGKDFRFLAAAKKQKEFNLTPYTQVFDDKFGFLTNLSILDLLFMEGPNALNYLENHPLNI
ncbi:MAG TPA: WbqC family protein, partial [Flavobacteriaceae bacterium]|nr:WbqC family protein [Flavobacteriaceae bacterium]